MRSVLTDNLPLLAGAPNGIKKLRELILELAVRGKLVPQEAGDEPASELLKRIAIEQSGLVRDGKIRSPKALVKVADDEEPFSLPSTWEWTRLGSQVIESGAGWSPNCESRPRTDGEWGVLKVSAVSWGVYQPDQNKALPANLEARPEHEVLNGDFLVSRANTAELVARSVVVETTPSRLMLSDKIVRLRLTEKCNRRYINLVNSSRLARDYYSQVAGGTSGSMKNISREQILNLPIAIAPLAEQHRIVAKVDELMALCDTLEAQQADADSAHARLVQALLDSLTQASDAQDFSTNWQRLSAHFDTLFTTESSIDALKQTLLQLAVMGKLVPQDPGDGAACGIREEKGLFNIPNAWTWARLSSLLPDFQNGASSRGDSEGLPVTVIRLADIRDGEICLDEPRRLVMSPETVKKHSLQVDDLLVIRVNGSADLVGRFIIVRGENDMIPCDHFIRMRFVDGSIGSDYLKMIGDSDVVRSAIAKLFVSTAGQKTVNQGHIGSLLLPLPPLAEQHRIVAKVDELMALCDQLKAHLRQARDLNQQLATTLVERAVA